MTYIIYRLAILLFVVSMLMPLTTCANGNSKSRTHIYYVHPEGNCTLCPTSAPECHPLSYYVQNISKFFASNTNLIFLRGDHILNISGPVNIENVNNFTMTGNGSVTKSSDHQIPQPSSNIICNKSNGFYFHYSQEISLQRLRFINCGASLIVDDGFNLSAAITFFLCTNVILTNVVINGSAGFGLHADQNNGTFCVTNSAFMRSRSTDLKFYGGNARFWYSKRIGASKTTLKITSSWFMYGSPHCCPKQNRRPSNASGLVILIYHPHVHVQIDNITAMHNRGYNGGNIAISLKDFKESNSRISITNSRIGFGFGHRGGGLRFWHSKSQYTQEYPTATVTASNTVTVMNISNTVFYNNSANSTGGAIYISHYEHYYIDYIVRNVTLHNCTFTGNYITGNDRSHSGAALEIIKHKIPDFRPHNTPQFAFSMTNCSFTSNYLDGAKTEGGIVDIVSSKAVNIADCQFINNNGSSIYLRDGSVVFGGNILFKNNHATFGGALKFCDSSMMYLWNKTIVTFENNFASIVGGAIFVSQEQCKETVPPCFFQPINSKKTSPKYLKNNIQLNFINNRANKSGDAVYGGSVDYCYAVYHFPTDSKKSTSGEIFNATFNLTQQHGYRRVSSDPYGACFCNNTGAETPPDCNNNNKSIHVYPGQTFSMSVTAVGQRRGIVPGVHIEARLKNNKLEDSELIPHYPYNYSRWFLKSCRQLHYILYTNKSKETIILRVMEFNPAESRYHQHKDPQITMVVAPCPWGFKLTDKPPYKCDCDPLLEKHGFHCDINTQLIHHPKGHIVKLIGCEKESTHSSPNLHVANSSQCTQLTLALSCPVGYCNYSANNISLETISEQCEGNREGRLCGACSKGYSVAIGSTNCLSTCSTYYLYIMIIVFALAGILLILFLTICNLTVTEGTITGLLFYANIVHQYKYIFLTDYPNNYNLIRVFIAWVNLDFGFNVCFYPHMTMYEKTWLQFGFLFYIWALELIIIALSHKFIFFTRLVGRNVAKVLATLLLISYPKLLSTAINSIKYAHIYKSNGTTKMVWSPEGNIDYLNGKHTPLFVTGVLLCIFASLYTLSLLLIQCLQRRSQLWCLRWVDKLRPFFDSYTGPFRDNYRFWPGFLLFWRITLYILSANLENQIHYKIELYTIIAVCVVILVVACVSPHGIYKKWTLNLLELTFILKLGLLSGAVLAFANSPPHVQVYYITFPSVGIAIAIFAAIIVYHTYKLVRHSFLFRRMSVWYIRRQALHNPIQHYNIQRGSLAENAEEASPFLGQNLPPVLRYDRYRESLLED